MTGAEQKAPLEESRPSASDTFPRLLLQNAASLPGRDAMREKSYGIWRRWNWAEMCEQVHVLAYGLSRLGIARGDRVALIGDNRPRLYWSIAALQALGAVPVPLFPDAYSPELAARLTQVKARFAIVEGQEEVDNLVEAMADNPGLVGTLAGILYDRPRGMRRYTQPLLHALDDVMDQGAAAALEQPSWLTAEIAAGRAEDAAIILFTSGATGEPKPVLLSHDLLIQAGGALAAQDRLSAREEVLAYMPMAWYADHIPSYVQSHITGYCVSCPESGETVLADLREVGPTYFIAPSRLFEKIQRDAMARMADAGWFKRWLFVRFSRQAPPVGAPLAGAIPDAGTGGILGELLIRGPLRNALGLGRMRTVYTLGEALTQSAERFYRMIGIDIRRCYGVVEAGGFVAAQIDAAPSAEDLGPLLSGMEIKVAEDGELLIRGPAPFPAYDGSDNSDVEEWFASGDTGQLDGAGNLQFIGRTGEVGQLANGDPFSPGAPEARLKAVPEIGEAMVIGRGRAYCVALLCLEASAGRALAEAGTPKSGGGGEFAWFGQAYDLLHDRLSVLNEALAGDTTSAALQIRRFLVLPREFSVAAGEITRSRQLRRHVIEEKFAALIEALYADTAGSVAWGGEDGPELLEIRAVAEAG